MEQFSQLIEQHRPTVIAILVGALSLVAGRVSVDVPNHEEECAPELASVLAGNEALTRCRAEIIGRRGVVSDASRGSALSALSGSRPGGGSATNSTVSSVRRDAGRPRVMAPALVLTLGRSPRGASAGRWSVASPPGHPDAVDLGWIPRAGQRARRPGYFLDRANLRLLLAEAATAGEACDARVRDPADVMRDAARRGRCGLLGATRSADGQHLRAASDRGRPP